MTRLGVSTLCFGLLIGLSACSSGGPASNVAQNAAVDAASVWRDREARYRDDAAASASGGVDQLSGERQRGRLAVLSAYREYRRVEPAARAAVDWLRTRHAAHRGRLLDSGLEIDRLADLVASPARLAAVKLEETALKSLAYNLGSVAEVRLIYRELRTGAPGQTEVAAGKAKPLGSPPDYNPDYNIVSRGVMGGIGGFLGRF